MDWPFLDITPATIQRWAAKGKWGHIRTAARIAMRRANPQAPPPAIRVTTRGNTVTVSTPYPSQQASTPAQSLMKALQQVTKATVNLRFNPTQTGSDWIYTCERAQPEIVDQAARMTLSQVLPRGTRIEVGH